ncbi:MAG: transcription elongation factor GreB [Pseudomonadales bacterium]
MSRYRPPAPRSAPYITPEGHARLTAELKSLWKDKRPEVTRKVAEAAAMGDRSENAEYIYGKRQLREIDARIRFLSRRLDELKVVDRVPPDRSRVFFGAWVSLADGAGEVFRYRLVGPDEFDQDPTFISIDSPLARALLGRRVGDRVSRHDRQTDDDGRADPDTDDVDLLEIMAIDYRSDGSAD